MTPTQEQIAAARAWLEECHMTFGSAVLNVAMAELAATYAAHCVAEEVAEKDKEIVRLRGALEYIREQATLNHPGALGVIRLNAEGALNIEWQKALAALGEAKE